jgi:hypothetical protein
VCRSFWLTEISGEYAFASTNTHYHDVSSGFVSDRYEQDLSSRVVWTVGPMFNVSPGGAVGATVSAGFVRDGGRYAIEARRRWWPDELQSRPTFDLSAGLVRVSIPPGQNGFARDVYGLTVGEYVIGADLIQVNARGDLLLTGGQVRGGATVGVGFGSYAAAGATVLAAALVGVAIIALANSHWE